MFRLGNNKTRPGKTPNINWSHPATKGLEVAAYPVGGGVGNAVGGRFLYEAAECRLHALNESWPTASYLPAGSLYGPTWDSNRQVRITKTDASHHVWFMWVGKNDSIYVGSDGGNELLQCGAIHLKTTSAGTEVQIEWEGSVLATNDSCLTLGKNHVIVARIDYVWGAAPTSGHSEMWVDGAKHVVGTGSPASTYARYGRWELGSYNGSAPFSKHALMLGWNPVFGAGPEGCVEELSSDPWCIFRPTPIFLAMPPASGITYNPAETISATTNTSNADIALTYNPLESFDAASDTSVANILVATEFNPVETFPATSNTSSASVSISTEFNPTESIGAITNTSSANITIDGTYNPAESIPAVTNTTSASISIASAIASRTSGVAPFHVFIDGTGTVSSSTSYPIRDLWFAYAIYRDGEFQGMRYGMNIAYTCETAGAYTIQQYVWDANGLRTSNAALITITASAFSGTTYAFSNTSNFTGCTAQIGNRHTTSDLSTAIAYAGTDVKLEFKRGDTWTDTTLVGSAQNIIGPLRVTAFGTGTGENPERHHFANDPIWQSNGTWASSQGFVEIGGSDITISHIQLIAGTTSVHADNLLGNGQYRCDNILIRRCQFNGNHIGSVLLGYSHDRPDYLVQNAHECIYTEDCCGCNSYGIMVYQGGHRYAMCNCHWDTSDTSHICRWTYIYKGWIWNTTFKDPANTSSPPDRACFKLHAQQTRGRANYNDYTEFIVIGNNQYIGEQQWMVEVAPQNTGSNEWLRNFDICCNRWTHNGTAIDTYLVLQAANVAIRANSFDDNLGTVWTTMGISIERRNAVAPIPSQIVVYQNSAYCAATGHNSVYLVNVANHTGDVEIKNNILYAPGISTVAIKTGAGSSAESNNQLTDPSFLDAAAGDFTLQSGSNAIGGGSTSIPVHFDANQFEIDSAPDIGAHEYGAFTWRPSLNFHPAEFVFGTTNTSSATISIGGVHNPAESVFGVTNTKDATISISDGYCPSVNFQAITATVSSTITIYSTTEQLQPISLEEIKDDSTKLGSLVAGLDQSLIEMAAHDPELILVLQKHYGLEIIVSQIPGAGAAGRLWLEPVDIACDSETDTVAVGSLVKFVLPFYKRGDAGSLYDVGAKLVAALIKEQVPTSLAAQETILTSFRSLVIEQEGRETIVKIELSRRTSIRQLIELKTCSDEG